MKYAVLILTTIFQILAIAHEVGNGDLDGIYKVKDGKLPDKGAILSMLKVSQLPADILDPLKNEIVKSHYLDADRDVEFTGQNFPGDWYVGKESRFFFARTIPEAGGATTLFPIFYKQSEEKRIEIIFHEAIHRLDFLAPNNKAEDFVEASVKLILEDIQQSSSGSANGAQRQVSREKLKSWFAAASAQGNVPINKMHWVGMVNIRAGPQNSNRLYSSSLLSIIPTDLCHDSTSARGLYKCWYVESKTPIDQDFPIKADVTPAEFFKTRKIQFKMKDYYLKGSMKSALSPIEGEVFENSSSLFAGNFVLYPLHDGGTGIGLAARANRLRCIDPYAAPSQDCYDNKNP